MIITFCGHSHFDRQAEYEPIVLALFEKLIGNDPVSFYLGEYGEFDFFAYRCAKKYKENHPGTSLIFVTPYLTPEYQKNHLVYQKTRFDSILYPDIETVPLRFAISHRNRYMVDKADCVIAYVQQSWGGAYQTYQYAKRKGKAIFNLSDNDPILLP